MWLGQGHRKCIQNINGTLQYKTCTWKTKGDGRITSRWILKRMVVRMEGGVKFKGFSGSGTGCTQPREYKLRSYLKEK
jgi:hypothetical protein